MVRLYKNCKNYPELLHISQSVSDNFVEDCRKLNSNKMPLSELNKRII